MMAPVIVLVRPQLAENIGMAARAMLNCGLTELRLVRPDEAPDHPRALAAATHADGVLRSARVFDTVEAAVGDLHHVFATCPRHRDMVKEVITPRAAAADLRAMVDNGERPAILFGPERTGLESDEISLADVQVSIPLNPDFNSLNLAQAVLVMGYEWWQARAEAPDRVLVTNKAVPATKGELAGFFRRLEAALDECGFLRDERMRPTMILNIRAMFQRAGLMSHEINTLQGIVTGLTERPHASSIPGSRPGKRSSD
ncbi:MAG: RNA methyltransferase [Alphaproteobacteria bacterium]|nr:RNA methyltransferase [Alphaproteobacteria bacterium]